MKKIFSTYETARILGVHHTTIINWVKDNKITAFVTPGGHRRIEKNNLINFAQKYKIPLPEEFVSKTKKILIVDDDLEILNEMRDALDGNGFEIDLANNGFQAAKKIYENKPNLILLDFKMPGMDGFEVCRILKRNRATEHIPIFAVTVLNTEEDLSKIKSCGVDEYISKPVDIKRLLKLIKKTLQI